MSSSARRTGITWTRTRSFEPSAAVSPRTMSPARQLGAQLGLAHRDDGEVPVRLPYGAQHAVGAVAIGERRIARLDECVGEWTGLVDEDARGRGAVRVAQRVGQRLVEHHRAEVV